MNDIKVGASQNEFYKVMAQMCKPTGLFKDVLLGEKDGKLYLIFIPSVLYEDVVEKYKSDDADRDLDDIKYLAQMPDDGELKDKNFFFGIAENVLKNIIRKVVGDGRTEYVSEDPTSILEEEE